MTHFYVKWDIDIEADNAEEAACIAQDMQRDPNSLATIYHVILDTGYDSKNAICQAIETINNAAIVIDLDQ